jgi:hypothetical protein
MFLRHWENSISASPKRILQDLSEIRSPARRFTAATPAHCRAEKQQREGGPQRFKLASEEENANISNNLDFNQTKFDRKESRGVIT